MDFESATIAHYSFKDLFVDWRQKRSEEKVSLEVSLP